MFLFLKLFHWTILHVTGIFAKKDMFYIQQNISDNPIKNNKRETYFTELFLESY